MFSGHWSRLCLSRVTCTPSFGLAFLPSSSSLDACRGRPGHPLKRVFRFCVRRPRRSSACHPCASSRDFCQPSSRPRHRGVLRVSASSCLLSVAMLPPSQPPHKNIRTNPVVHLERKSCSAAVESMTLAHVGGDVTDPGAIGDWW